MSGYIFDYRQELESDIWLLPPMYHRVWQYLKYKANHAEGRIPNADGTVTILRPGQHATSYRHIAKGVGYYEGRKWVEPNPKTIKKILDWLSIQNMIVLEGNRQGTVVTIVNWGLYQSEIVKGNTKVTPRKHTVDTNKKNKEELKNKYTTEFESLYSDYPRRENKMQTFKNYKSCLKKHSHNELLQAVCNYSKEKKGTDRQYLKSSSNFFGRDAVYLDYLDENWEGQQTKPKVAFNRNAPRI